jgi:hypothetical protein
VACPVCSARISKDLLEHITLQHGYLFKLQRHHRLRRVAGAGSHTLSYAGRDLQETYLKVLLGNSGRSSSTTNTSTSVTDSLLSSLVLNLSSSEAEDTSKSSAPAVAENSWFKRSLPSKNWKIRYNPILFLPLITISLLSLLHVMWLFFLVSMSGEVF